MGLEPTLPKIAVRGKKIHGQYNEANPGHAAKLDEPLDASLAGRWAELAASMKISPERVATAKAKATRGEFIRTIFAP
jgi:hypothetical protein